MRFMKATCSATKLFENHYLQTNAIMAANRNTPFKLVCFATGKGEIKRYQKSEPVNTTWGSWSNPANGYDGDYTTATTYTTSTAGTYPYVTHEYSTKAQRKVHIDAVTSYSICHVQVQTSDDGSSWTTVLDITTSRTSTLVDVDCKYIRIVGYLTSNSNTTATIYEYEVVENTPTKTDTINYPSAPVIIQYPSTDNPHLIVAFPNPVLEVSLWDYYVTPTTLQEVAITELE